MTKHFLIIITLFLNLLSCSKDSDMNSTPPSQLEPTTTGTGFFVFSDYVPLSTKPMKIYYHIPNNLTANTPIVFVFHGGGRNAKDYRDAIIAKANQYNFIAISPEFSNSNFPGGDGYNLGNVYEDGDNPSDASLNNEAVWTFSVIEPLFDAIKLQLNNTSTSYDVIGHSAGGQFAHRFAMFKPNARFDTMVASAAGWYTEVNQNITFPYGFGDSLLQSLSLDNLFNKKIIIQVGALDTNPNDSGLRHNDIVDLQGSNRRDRAIHFFNAASQLATNQSLTFNWQLDINPNADHDYSVAVKHAADLIFN